MYRDLASQVALLARGRFGWKAALKRIGCWSALSLGAAVAYLPDPSIRRVSVCDSWDRRPNFAGRAGYFDGDFAPGFGAST